MKGSVIKHEVTGNVLVGSFARFLDRVSDKVVDRQHEIIKKLTEKILARTPVWMGDTVHNWKWSVGHPDTSFSKSPAQGSPGPTNSMPLGSEPRRSASERAPKLSMATVLKINAPVTLFLTNGADSAVGIEYGLLPSKERSRVDGARGVVRLSIAEIEAGID